MVPFTQLLSLDRESTESESLGEKKQKPERGGVCWQLLLCCHGRVKQTQLRNCNPNRGHREGRAGQEKWREEGLLGKKTAPVFLSKSVLLRRSAGQESEETAVAAASSSVPADREQAFVCSTGSTVNSIGWHGLECDIIVFFF